MTLLTSFVPYGPEHPFPIQNLPYGVFSTEADPTERPGVAIGDLILDLAALSRSSWFDKAGVKSACFQSSTLNNFIALDPQAWTHFRSYLQNLLASHSPLTTASVEERNALFVDRLATSTSLHLPIEIGDYTDFYSSIEHATNCGTLFRGKENALQKNWRWLPVGYHGRASSIVVSGTPFHRPSGQILPDPTADAPVFAPCKRLDYELEMGFVYGGSPTKMGQRLTPASAQAHLFGCFLLNDWSSRDIQAWEYVPLGPFLSKNFCTTVSPWIVPLEALQPFKAEQYRHDPPLLDYLQDSDGFNFDVPLQVAIRPSEAEVYTVVSHSNLRHTYYTPAQMLAHHSTTGCPMRPGDVLGTGTLSAPGEDGYGSLLEKSLGGKRPFDLCTAKRAAAGNGTDGAATVEGKDAQAWGEDKVSRTFLQDGDTVRMSARVRGDGYCIGFGECEATVLPALE